MSIAKVQVPTGGGGVAGHRRQPARGWSSQPPPQHRHHPNARGPGRRPAAEANPAARTEPKSPSYGRTIIGADQAQNVIVMKRSMRSGFAGIDNDLFYEPKTSMLFGDAKDVATALATGVKNL